MYRRRLAAFAGAIGLLGALFSSGVAARADTAISDAQFTTMVDSYVAQAISGQGLCLSVPMTNDGTCPSSTQWSTDQNNIEVCVEHDTAGPETCSIEQHNMTGHNIAIVVQFYGKTQMANQTASITQMNVDGSNLAAIVQIVKESTRSGITQMDDQKASISQSGSTSPMDAGRNLTILHQSSTQFGQAGPSDTQEQDSSEHGDISQSRGSVSRAHADQSQSQTLKGMGAQTQHLDPRCCMSQQSNPNNSGDISQQASQFADNPAALQDSSTVGDCSSSGNCSVDQTASINGSTPVRQHCGPTSCSIGIVCSTASGCSPCSPVPTETGPPPCFPSRLMIAAAYGHNAPTFGRIEASPSFMRGAQPAKPKLLMT